MERAPAGRMEWVEITPALAEAWLRSSDNYRKLRPHWVTTLAAQIKRDGWHDTGDPFKLNSRQKMVDGQHRAAAIVSLGITVWAWVCVGVDDPGFLTIHPRLFSDVLAARRLKNVHELAAAVRALWNQRRGFAQVGVTRANIQELCDELSQHTGIADSLAKVMCVKAAGIKGLPLPMLAVIHYMAGCEDLGLADSFIRKLASGIGLGSADPILWLRKAFALDAARRERYPREVRFALVIIHWNKWLQGIPCRQTSRWASTGAFASEFPKIVLPSEVKQPE